MLTPLWVRRAADVTGAVVIALYTLLLTFVAIVGSAETVTAHLPEWLFKPLPMLLFILMGLVVLRFGSAPGGPAAAIRGSFVKREDGSGPFLVLENIGGHEATHLIFDDVIFGGYPWTATFHDIGSVPAGMDDCFVHEVIRHTPSAETCTAQECQWSARGDSLDDFVEGASHHRLYHVPEYQQRYGLPVDPEALRLQKEFGPTVRYITIEARLIVHFKDEITREGWASHHTMQFDISVNGLFSARCHFDKVVRETRRCHTA